MGIRYLDHFFQRAEAATGDDNRLSSVLADMAEVYSIPPTKALLAEWRQKTPEAERILSAYYYIQKKRTL